MFIKFRNFGIVSQIRQFEDFCILDEWEKFRFVYCENLNYLNWNTCAYI
jgi:hypothetical protein